MGVGFDKTVMQLRATTGLYGWSTEDVSMPKKQESISPTPIISGDYATPEQAVTSALLGSIAAEQAAPEQSTSEWGAVLLARDFDTDDVGKVFADAVMLPMILWSAGMSLAFSWRPLLSMTEQMM